MPHSDRRLDDGIVRWIRGRVPVGSRIIDVGAGSGKWADMLGGAYELIAIEIFDEYIERYQLREKYRGVINADARELSADHLRGSALIIVGDMLEHLSVPDAQCFLSKVKESGTPALIIVPYQYVQHGTAENPHEEHLQPDLTEHVFMSRYADAQPVPLMRESNMGVFVINSPDPFKTADSVDMKPEDFDGMRLAICTPQPGHVAAIYLKSMVETSCALTHMRVPFTVFIPTGAIIDKIRNLGVKEAMSHTAGFTHILFIDSDQGWQVGDLLRLLLKALRTGKELLAYASVKKTEISDWAVNFLGNNGGGEIVEDGTIEVEGVGTGFMLIARTAIEKMFQAYPELAVRNPSHENSSVFVHHPNDYALFQTVLDKSGRYVGEDLTFCHRWRDIGGSVWVDPTGDLQHVGAKVYRGALIVGIKPNPVQPT